jgi:hypothetical protein
LFVLLQRGYAGEVVFFVFGIAGGCLAPDARINFFTCYYSISLDMFSYTPGKGTNYLIAFTDDEGPRDAEQWGVAVQPTGIVEISGIFRASASAGGEFIC